MKVFVFADKGALERVHLTRDDILRLMEMIAEGTDTQSLVVAVYMLGRDGTWEAHSDAEEVRVEEFTKLRGSWKFVERFGTPDGLPQKFPLIRIALGVRRQYPLSEEDIYGWRMTFQSFEDHLAYTFAHELHHFRRDHLGLHPGEGEQSAIRWGVARVGECAGRVEGMKMPVRKRRKMKQKHIILPRVSRPHLLGRIKSSASQLSLEDLRELKRWALNRLSQVRKTNREKAIEAYREKLRALPEGAPVVILQDDSAGGYTGQIAVKVRGLRRNSPRMLIRTADGEEWLWLLEWLAPLEQMPDQPAQPELFADGSDFPT